MNNGATSIDVLTNCSYCNEFFALGVPIVGEPPEIRMSKLLGQLQQHMAAKHSDKMPSVQVSPGMFMPIEFVAAQAFGTLAFLSKHFVFTDPAIVEYRANVYRAVRQMVTPVPPPSGEPGEPEPPSGKSKSSPA